MKNIMFWKKEMSAFVMSGILSVVNLLFYNIPFLNFVTSHADMGGFRQVFLIATFVVIVLALNFMVFYLLLKLRLLGKIMLALFSVLSATCTYFVITYHTMMDESMMGNVFNTRYSEASVFFSWGLVAWIIVFGILPAVWICIQQVERGTWKTWAKSSGASVALALLLILLNMNQVLWIGKYDTELGGLTMPWSYVANSIRLWSHQRAKQVEEIKLPDATFDDNERSAMVLVIGESARKANFSLYGYQRNTNPCLSKVDSLHVLEARSCATYTTAGVKSILEYKATGDLYEILPNYLHRLGVDVVWRTSNWGEPPVHIDEYVSRKELAAQYGVEGQQHDEVLFMGLKERIEQSQSNKVIVIIHTSTSHGPDYQRQYPEKFEMFKPVCSSVEQAEKERDRLINAYDNSIVYTDWLLSNVIDTLSTITDRHCAMVYVSDHGESLGENDLFMHGMPMKMAPREQYEIPFIIWTDGSYRTFVEPNNVVDQHYVFHTVLKWLGISSPIYNQSTSCF